MATLRFIVPCLAAALIAGTAPHATAQTAQQRAFLEAAAAVEHLFHEAAKQALQAAELLRDG